MLNLNLLPPQEKSKLLYTMRMRAVLILGGVAMFVVLGSLILLLPSIFWLTVQKSEVIQLLAQEQERQVKTGARGEIERIASFNSLAKAIKEHEKDQPRLFELLVSVLRAAPPSIQLEALVWSPKERELAVEGFSPQRTVLIEFLKTLEQNPRVSGVSSPITNIIREANIRFSLVVSVAK